jgi:16S rRNA processing protein RimM
MNKDQCFYLGSVAKLHGYKGGLSLYLDVDYPDDYTEMESVFIEINKQLVPFFLDSSKRSGSNLLTAKFEGIDTEEDARALLRKSLYLPVTVLPALDGNKFYYHEVIGFDMIDERLGNVGKVTEIFDHPTNPLFMVSDGTKESVIPIQDHLLVKVDRANKSIHVNTPEGLIEANW